MSPQRDAISEYFYATIQTLSSLQKQYLPRALASEEMNGPGQKYLEALNTPKVLLSPNPGIHDEQCEVGAHSLWGAHAYLIIALPLGVALT